MLDIFMKVFPGVSQMENIHPIIVHFPIALLNAFLIMELLGFVLKKEDLRIAATWMLYLGTLGAVAAVSAGLWAASTVPHTEEEHLIILKHRNFGVAVLTMGVILSAWRIRVNRKFSIRGQVLYLVIALIMITSIAFGADLGGLMVYKYGVAVKAAPKPKAPMHHHGIFGGDETGTEHHGDMEDMNQKSPMADH